MNKDDFTKDNVKTDNSENTFTSDNVNSTSDTENDNEITNNNVKTGREKSIANLVPFTSEQSQEQAKINGRLGGIKSGKVRRERKTARELLTDILVKSLTDEQIEEILGSASALLGDDKSAYNVMMVKALQGAMQGDVKSQMFIRDTVGDAPVNKQEVQATITDADKQLIDTVRQRLLS